MIYGLVVYASEIDDWLGRAKEITDLFEGDKSSKCSIFFSDIDCHNANQVGTLCRKMGHGDTLIVNSIASFTNLKAKDLKQVIGVLKSYSVNVYPMDMKNSYERLMEIKGCSFGYFKNFLIEYLESNLATTAALYNEHWRRHREGIEKAKRERKYQGRPIDLEIHKSIHRLLKSGFSIRQTADMAGISPTTVQKSMKRWGKDPDVALEAIKEFRQAKV